MQAKTVALRETRPSLIYTLNPKPKLLTIPETSHKIIINEYQMQCCRVSNMTLILTELSNYGIAMATDSAITETLLKPDGTVGDKDYYGARKLFTVPKLSAGI